MNLLRGPRSSRWSERRSGVGSLEVVGKPAVNVSLPEGGLAWSRLGDQRLQLSADARRALPPGSTMTVLDQECGLPGNAGTLSPESGAPDLRSEDIFFFFFFFFFFCFCLII